MDGARPGRPWRLLGWGGLLALGISLLFTSFSARSEVRETRDLVRRLQRENGDLRAWRDRLRTTVEALERDDPIALRQELQKHGFVLDGRIMVVEPPDPPSLADDPPSGN